MTGPRPIPYPADTRAKGWRFELDYERIEQSDTWAIAEEVPMAQHALVFMWLAAWKQEPCGSFPNDESVIRSKCRIPTKFWLPMRDVLMRGWWLAEDDRLYHDTLTKRVLEMLEYRAGNAKRVAKHKEAMRLKRLGNALPTHQEPVKNDTGTGTYTGRTQTEDFDCVTGTHASDPLPFDPEDGEVYVQSVVQGAEPTRYGSISKALRLAGIGNAQPGLMRFRLLVDAGADAAEFMAFVPKALGIQGDRFAYIVGAVEGERKRATATLGQLHRGAMPNRQEAIEQRNNAVGDAWLAEQGAA